VFAQFTRKWLANAVLANGKIKNFAAYPSALYMSDAQALRNAATEQLQPVQPSYTAAASSTDSLQYWAGCVAMLL